MSLHGISMMVVTPLLLVVGGIIVFTPADILRQPVLPNSGQTESVAMVEAEETPVDAAPDLATTEIVDNASPVEPVEPAEQPLVIAAVENPAAEEAPADFRWVSAGALNLREGPSTGDATIASLPQDTKVKVLETSGGWAYVDTATGQKGWLATKFLTAQEPAVAQ